MHFIDEAIIKVQAGDGGNGCIAFRREKYRPRGGPCGGNGGRGGHVIIQADHNLSTLLDFRYRSHYKAPKGEHGRGKDQHGASGEDLVLTVPTGTLVYSQEDDSLLADLTTHGEELTVAEGGRGGFGNMHYTTATRQAPDFAQPGRPGESTTLRLELKLLADVGVIGFPNVGKSTLIARLSKAKPKIADYPFTTLTPNLGVVAPPGRNSFVMADVPGLIPGAHKGSGLGIRFLRHVERTRVFLHMLELSEDSERDPRADFETITEELALYDQDTNSALSKTPTIVALNKVEDTTLATLARDEYAAYFEERDLPFFVISALSGEGLTPMLHALADLLEAERQEHDPPAPSTWDPLSP